MSQPANSDVQNPDPIDRFRQIFDLAKEKVTVDPTATTLSTCTRDGYPSSRVVLLKDITEQGFVFFTNYHSRKSREMTDNPHVSLCFYWPEINHQVRVEGTVSKISMRDSDAYFETRPRLSQISAWASDQSQPLRSRQDLLARAADLETKYQDQPVPRPSFWGGYLVRPTTIEFWINGEFRLHDRFLYTRESTGTWFIQRLNP